MAHYAAGTIRAIEPITEYSVSALSEALRFFTRGIHMGKLVISYDDPAATVMCRPRSDQVKLDPVATYLIIGGMGGLGKALIEWMMEKGARKLVVLSRSGLGVLDEDAKAFLQRITDNGGELISVKGDAQSRADIQRFVDVGASPSVSCQ